MESFIKIHYIHENISLLLFQEEVYEATTKNLAQDVLNGYNATVFAYGATGSGKTHTMVGTSSNPGIMVRALNDIFLAAKKLPDDAKFTVSFLNWKNFFQFFPNPISLDFVILLLSTRCITYTRILLKIIFNGSLSFNHFSTIFVIFQTIKSIYSSATEFNAK